MWQKMLFGKYPLKLLNQLRSSHSNCIISCCLWWYLVHTLTNKACLKIRGWSYQLFKHRGLEVCTNRQEVILLSRERKIRGWERGTQSFFVFVFGWQVSKVRVACGLFLSLLGLPSFTRISGSKFLLLRSIRTCATIGAQCGAWAHGPEIKSFVLYWLI